VLTTMALLAACGGDDGDDEATNSTPAEDDGGDGDGGNGDGGDGGDADGDDLSAFIAGYGGCAQALGALSAVFAAALNPAGGEVDTDVIEELADNVPDDIAEEVAYLQGYYAQYAAALADAEPSDFANPNSEYAQTIADLEEEYPPEDVQEANDALTAWFEEECPALEGDG
jgi:hypothetical protein